MPSIIQPAGVDHMNAADATTIANIVFRKLGMPGGTSVYGSNRLDRSTQCGIKTHGTSMAHQITMRVCNPAPMPNKIKMRTWAGGTDRREQLTVAAITIIESSRIQCQPGAHSNVSDFHSLMAVNKLG